MEFKGRDAELAALLDRAVSAEKSGQMVVALRGLGGIGKTAIAAEYARSYLHSPSTERNIRLSFREVDTLHDQLNQATIQEIIDLGLPIAVWPRLACRSEVQVAVPAEVELPAASAPIAPEPPPASVPALPATEIPLIRDILVMDAADEPWSSTLISPFLVTDSLFFEERTVRDSAHRRQPRRAGNLEEPQPRLLIRTFSMAIDEGLLSHLRRDLLRFIGGIRAALRLMLIRVLNALARCPDTIKAVLVLLAATRCYGRRTEPSDYILPVLTSMSAVTGRLPACVS